MTSTSSKNRKLILRAIMAMLAVIVLASSLVGCYAASGYLTEEQQVKKQNSILQSLTYFSFDGYTCSGTTPKFVIKIDPETPYYVLPSSDKIKVPGGVEYHMYLGEPYLQPLRPSETIDVPAGEARTITIVLTAEGQEVTVRGMVVNLGNDPTPYYIGLPNIEGVKYFKVVDGVAREIDPIVDTYVDFCDDFKFMIGLDAAYSNSIISVTANGKPLVTDNDGIYTISTVSEDIIVEISGVQINAEP